MTRPLARLAVFTMAAFVVACDVLTPFEQVCEKRLAPAAVEVLAVPMTYATDFSRSAAELSARGAVALGRMTLGYIETRLTSTVSFGGKGVVHLLTRRYCLRPDVQLKLEFAPTTLYVAREQPEGSCAFQITMDHEMQHFHEYQLFLAEFAQKMATELAAQFGERIFYYDSPSAAEKDLQQRVQDGIQQHVVAGMAELQQRQEKHDTPEEYLRLETFQAACRS
jgi:hypothetical protein